MLAGMLQIWSIPGSIQEPGVTMATYPRLLPIRHQLYSKPIQDIPAAVREAMRAAVPEGKIRKGQRIGITSGSRGIDKIGLVLKAAVDLVKERGGDPFL